MKADTSKILRPDGPKTNILDAKDDPNNNSVWRPPVLVSMKKTSSARGVNPEGLEDQQAKRAYTRGGDADYQQAYPRSSMGQDKLQPMILQFLLSQEDKKTSFENIKDKFHNSPHWEPIDPIKQVLRRIADSMGANMWKLKKMYDE